MPFHAKTTTELMASSLIVALYAGLAGFLMAVFFVVFALGDYRLALTDPILSEVTGKEMQVRVRQGSNGGTYKLYSNWVDLAVPTEDGRVARFGLEISYASYDALVVGQQVLVRYNPSNPMSSILDSDYRPGLSRDATLIFACLAVTALAISVPLFVRGRANARRMIRTRDRGQAREAVVIAHETSIWHGGKTGIGMAAVWRDEKGRSGQTFWIVVPYGQPPVHPLPVGTPIRVYVEGGQSLWEGDVGTRP